VRGNVRELSNFSFSVSGLDSTLKESPSEGKPSGKEDSMVN
jgi:hypothetical protein